MHFVRYDFLLNLVLLINIFIQFIGEECLKTPKISVLEVFLLLGMIDVVDFGNDYGKLVTAGNVDYSLVHEKGDFERGQLLFGLACTQISFGIGAEGPEVTFEIDHHSVLDPNSHVLHFDLFTYRSGSAVEAEFIELKLFIATLPPEKSTAIFHCGDIDGLAAAGTCENV